MKNIKKVLAVLLVLATILALSTAALASGKTLYATATVNLRKGAGLDYSVIRTLHKGDKLTQLDSAKDSRGVIWYKVKTSNGKTGWASSKYVKNNAKEEGTIHLTGNSYLRAKPNKDAKILDTATKGQDLIYSGTAIDSRGVIWYNVHCNGTKGWVSSKYTK